ncbi:N-6 DNA methylase [Deinococcus multiflagellatus]|uniref:N-6 DNA methylase n=1 Tax=Deinococcus multiflagellatus TaxID=1656887 RepID=A0ABW1ZH09_9DEIO|nr:N-6 DNA methylase [Deinococcus multiflagellatus]MBZ9713785.1 N-6 DNA methylase [Deinococcus multiflagellatus]
MSHIGDPLKLPFAKVLQQVTRLRVSEAFRILVTAGACALTAGQQEALYLDTIKGLHRQDLETIAHAFAQLRLDMEAHPFVDLLGPVYMEIAHQLDKQARGEFFTPYALSYAMAKMTAGDVRDLIEPGKILACNEPACGSGGMILAFSHVLVDGGVSPLHTRWVAQDISDTSCYATYINLTLWGIPATVVCGNTITRETRWAWPNLFWSMARPYGMSEDEARARRLLDAVRSLIAAPAPEPAPPPPAAPAPVVDAKPAPFGAEFGPLFGGPS